MRHPSLLCLAIALPASAPAAAADVVYVDGDARGANDGTSWNDAFVYLQDALAAARPGDQVWVAEGVYRPDQGAGRVLGSRDEAFFLPDQVALYGGFVGAESTLAAPPGCGTTAAG